MNYFDEIYSHGALNLSNQQSKQA